MKVFIITLVTLLLIESYARFTDNILPETLDDDKTDKRSAKNLDDNLKLDHRNELDEPEHTPVAALTEYGYHASIGIPQADSIRKYESERRYRRMLLGKPSYLGQHSYQGGLLITLTDGRISLCGCCLVSQNRALTAAHCWDDQRGGKARSLEVVLGSTRLFSGGVRVPTRDVIVHGNWSHDLLVNDIAMIRFRPVALSRTISPIALPSGKELYRSWVGWPAVASGYGDTETSVGHSRKLLHANVVIISNAVCQRMFENVLMDTMICTSDRNGAGPNKGDSGGPLAVRHKNKIVLVGVMSFDLTRNPPNSVVPNIPQGYTRVAKYIDWIHILM